MVRTRINQTTAHFHLFFMILSLLLSGCRNADDLKIQDKTLQLFAAAGTRLATSTICDRYEKKTGYKVERNFASSGILARQIANGASADVFVSANKQWIDFLINKGMLIDSAVHLIAGNSLVVVSRKDAHPVVPEFKNEFDVLSSISDKIAIGDPDYVPVGKYTKTALDNLGWFGKIKDKMIMAKDVSSVLQYVALGECDWGVVYHSEAIVSDKVKIIAEIPQALYDPIRFFVADLKAQKPEGHALLKMFQEKEGLSTFLKYGFLAPPNANGRRSQNDRF